MPLKDSSRLRMTCHLQIAQAQLERAGNIHHRLLHRNESPGTTVDFPCDKKDPYNGFIRDETADNLIESQVPSNKDNSQVASPSCPPGSQRKVAVATESAGNNPEGASAAAKVAAEVAAKLAASSSSAAMLTSVLSSLAAEEANGGVQSSSYSPDKVRPLEKRPRLDSSSEVVSAPDPPAYPLPPPMPQYFSSPVVPLPYAYQSILPPPPPPPLQGRVMMKQHAVGLPPQPIPPGCAPAAYQPFQVSGMPYYSQPPLPAPPAPRQ